MENPFDTKVLAERLKAKGLGIAEDLVVVVEKETLAWIKESLKLTEGKLDDLLIPLIEVLEPMIDKQIDKISQI